jgi:hypothetical protein
MQKNINSTLLFSQINILENKVKIIIKNLPSSYSHIQYFSQSHELKPSPSILEGDEVVLNVPTLVGSNYLNMS